DPKAAAKWYADVFGGEIVSEDEMRGAPQIVVNIHGVRMIIRGKRPGEAPENNHPLQQFDGFKSHNQWGADHFGLKVVGDFAGYCSAIKKKGVVFAVDPLEIRPGTHIAFITGPDGETIELVEGKSK
ncbi:MAG: VOC family protein, partial [Spirochaetales bacterium]|nr:VOC family protein [Spirochaetales bacterium]